MKGFALWMLFIGSLIGAAALAHEIKDIGRRITALEEACHAQCTHHGDGDAECAKRCDVKGHCPFQD